MDLDTWPIDMKEGKANKRTMIRGNSHKCGFPLDLTEPKPLTDKERLAIAKLPEGEWTGEMILSLLITIAPDEWATEDERKILLEYELVGLKKPRSANWK